MVVKRSVKAKANKPKLSRAKKLVRVAAVAAAIGVTAVAVRRAMKKAKAKTRPAAIKRRGVSRARGKSSRSRA